MENIQLKTGFNLVQENNEELKKNIAAMVILFSKNAMKFGALYASHSKRNIVTTEDIKRGMMLQCFIFENTPNLANEIKEIKETLLDDNDDVREDIIDEINDAADEVVINDETNFTESECKCVLCNSFNTINERWAAWEPQDNIYKIFKIHIENMN
jgi:hypothetical protein